MPLSPEVIALLDRYNPTLVLFPQRPDLRESPDAQDVPTRMLGDYHPCSAEFFLARVEQRDQPRPYILFPPRTIPTGLDALKTKLAGTGQPTVTRKWELDLADIPSQNGKQAWRAYGVMLREADNPYECVVYGRRFQGANGIVLQYWYLYVYNDFFNNHEGDWEMVAIRLGSDQLPIEMGFAAHHGGYRLPWAKVKVEGGSPLVYVAKGSHAAYPAYNPEGYSASQMDFKKNFPAWLNWAEWLAERAARFKPQLDFPPGCPSVDTTAPQPHLGEAVKPGLKPMPGDEPEPASSFWWLRYRGRWGSRHTRLWGWTGVASPWAPEHASDLRWTDPIAWIESLKPFSL